MEMYLWFSQLSSLQAGLMSLFFGLLIGSFANVVIYRLPIMIDMEYKKAIEDGIEEIVSGGLRDLVKEAVGKKISHERFNLSVPRSTCPKCNTKIAWYDNIPVLSWIILLGRCRHCKTTISPYYPIVELLIGSTSGLITYMLWPSPIAILLPVVITISLILLMIDIRHMLLPDVLTLSLLWLGLFSSAIGIIPTEPEEAILAVVGSYGFFWLIDKGMYLWKGVNGIGQGDVKFVAGLAPWVGIMDLPYVILAFCIVSIVLFFIADIVAKADIVNKETEAYKNHKETIENIRKDFGYNEKEEYKYKRIMPLGPSISIAFIFYLILEYLF